MSDCISCLRLPSAKKRSTNRVPVCTASERLARCWCCAGFAARPVLLRMVIHRAMRIAIIERHSALVNRALLASADKGTHARRTYRPAFRGVIVLDLRQQACVLCLAKNMPERPAGLRVFPEHGRRLARQTRQPGCRPATRITQSAVVQARENHVCPCQLTLKKEEKT